jgi:hypothetical protein
MSRSKLILASDVLHDAAVKRPASARDVSTRIQHLCDAVVGVLVEELIDQCHDFGAGFPELPGIQGPRERQRRRRTAPKPQVCGEPLCRFDQRDVLQEQSDHPLSFTIRSPGIVPESRKVGSQSENPLARLRVHRQAVRLSLSIIRFLRLDDLLQGAIPLRL